MVRPADGLRELHEDQGGASVLEFALLLGCMGLAMLLFFRVAFSLLIGNYEMITFMNQWPFP